MQSRFDILGIGVATVDDLFYVEAYPPADSKTKARRVERQCGGLTGTALVAAAKLGANCAYAGVLGDDELSKVIEQNFRSYGVDVSPAVRTPGARPIHAIIVVSESDGSRNIFYEGLSYGAEAMRMPTPELLLASGVLFVDSVLIDGNLQTVELAHEAGIPIVADLEEASDPHFPRLLGLVDHLVLGEGFARKVSGAPSPEGAIEALWTASRKAIVLTGGDRGAWYRSSEDPRIRHQQAFPVQVVDTTGCGDVFHGAYAFGLARGDSVETRVRFAAAAAALKATQRGGQAGAPTAKAVASLLASEAVMDAR